MESPQRASPSLSGSWHMSSSPMLRSPSAKLQGVNGEHMKRAFIATTRVAAIAHVLARHTMPVDFACP
eukprot:3622399-Prorocentrum_lima.AAC.1